MKKILKSGWVLAVLAALASNAGCARAGIFGFEKDTVRYKVTVTVETPEGIKTGSAVREVGKYTEPSILPEQGGTFYNIIKGEAVVVDLAPQRGFLFALMGDQGEAKNVYQTLKNKKDQFTKDPREGIRFVRFRDRGDPKTVESVDPKTSMETLGVSIRDIMVEATEDAVTSRSIDVLPWLPEFKGKRLDGNTYNYLRAKESFAHSLDSGSFLIMGD